MHIPYLTCAHSSLKRACAHLILPYTPSEVFVAFLVAENWYVGHIKDSLIPSAFKVRRKKQLAADVEVHRCLMTVYAASVAP